MKTPRALSVPVVISGCALAAVAGWMIMGLLFNPVGEAARGRGAFQAISENAAFSGQPKITAASGGFSHLQTIAARMTGDAPGKLPASGSLASEEAEELALRLRGEALAARAQADPQAFLTELSRGDDGNYYVREAALAAWSASDPEGAFLAMLKGPLDGTAVFTTLAQRDPARALALLKSATGAPPNRLDEAWRSVLRSWAKTDTAGLQAKLSSLSDRAGVGAQEVAMALARQDPSAAAAWVKTLPPEMQPDQVLDQIISRVAETDPEQAAQMSLSLPNIRPWSIAYRWGQKDPEGALRWAMAHPDSPLGNALNEYSLAKVAASNPSLAHSYLATVPPEMKDSVAARIAEGMARSDPAAALRWAAALPPGNGRDTALTNAALASTDKEMIPQFTALVPDVGPSLLWKTDPAAAARALAALPPQGMEHAWSMVEGDLQARPSTGAVLVEAMPEGSLRSNAAGSMAGWWAASDPAAAAAWVSRLPEGESRHWAEDNLLTNWSRTDPAGARRWVETLSPGPGRERAQATLKKIQPSASGEKP